MAGTCSRWAPRRWRASCGVAGAPEGSRNHTLNRAAFKLGQIVSAGHLEAEDAAAGADAGGQMAGLGEPEAARTIASGLAAGLQHPRMKRA